MSATLDDFQAKRLEKKMEDFARHSAELIYMMNLLTRKYPFEYSHGMQPKEIEAKHKHLVKEGMFKEVFSTYGNRIRDCFNKHKTAGKHYVHGMIHYYPLSCDEEGLIDHSRCENCQKL